VTVGAMKKKTGSGVMRVEGKGRKDRVERE
jgi:hypothetical protein